ncbi:hypothetical protein VK792_19385, partial [Mesobacterium sp. TK19101]
MPNFDKPPPGASPAPEEQLLGELVGTLAELKARYGTEGEELAWATHRALSRHVMQHEGPETWARFGVPPSGGPVKMLVHRRPLVYRDDAF